ncbi:MAG: hypothetical protein KKF27_21540 [Gammaproteobacteria bacterium]|nr:hypothetical protein [Gammaproteobacteria bacterium]
MKNSVSKGETYELELGQYAFGQPYKRFECPEWVIAYLDYIDNELQRVYWNINQESIESPFENTGGSYKNAVMEVEAYSWDDEKEQKYNFKWRDVEISWYKHLHRGTSINKEITLEEGVEMFNDCIKELRKQEKTKGDIE